MKNKIVGQLLFSSSAKTSTHRISLSGWGQRLVLVCLLMIALPCSVQAEEEAAGSATKSKGQYAIVIHGGAGGWPGLSPQDTKDIEQGIETALKVGRDILAQGGTSLDAVEQAIKTLENNPRFNSGKGAVYNAVGKHQLDASIMDGSNKQAGAVAAIGVAKNPISAARLVMDKTRHVLLAGEGANEFVRKQGADIVSPKYFWTEQTRREWKASQSAGYVAKPIHHYGTVGCVALDTHGNLAAGTSTGGLSEKMVGRVGDSPLIAAGTYADNETCAVSCTGVGELFIRSAIAYDVSARVRYAKQSLSSAVSAHIDDQLPQGTGGMIALNCAGEVVMSFNTKRMPRGVANSTGRFEILLDKEDNAKDAH